MLRKIILPVALLTAVAGCEEPPDEAEPPDGNGAAASAQQSFAVRLAPATTADDVIPQIEAAGHHVLVMRCEEQPSSSVRIDNPLASGAYTDLSCSAVLGGDAATGEASAALVTTEDDGTIGVAQQPWSPFGLACSAITLGSSLVAGYALCPRATNPRDKRSCDWLAAGGFGGLSLLCILF